MPEADFALLTIPEKTQRLYTEGQFIVAIRYYGYKINLYLLHGEYFEVFYHHKEDRIEKIDQMDFGHTRMKFYADQINLGEFSG